MRNRPPAIEREPASTLKRFEQVDDAAVAVLRWLNANHVDYVVVGPVARIVRGQDKVRGPVVVVPAPYGRNLDRLARALTSARARSRGAAGVGVDPVPDWSAPVKLTAEKLVGPGRWALRCGGYELDVEGRPAGVPRYQELLYEAAKFEVAAGVEIEVASPEDIEHYEHLRRTGQPTEIRVTRATRVPSA